jgi:mxaA protein
VNLRISSAAAALALALALAAGTATGAATPASAVLDLQVTEPRAFGWQVGDVLHRRVVLQVPPGWVLDARTLPRPVGQAGPQAGAVVLRQLSWGDAARTQLDLQYQVLQSPPALRTFELPALALSFDAIAPGGDTDPVRPEAAPVASAVPSAQAPGSGVVAETGAGGGAGGGRDASPAASAAPEAAGTPAHGTRQELRLAAFPVLVGPLTPEPPPTLTALGDLRPDAVAPALDEATPAQRAGVGLALAAVAASFLWAEPAVRRWRWRRRQPFAQAWRAIRTLPADSRDAAALEAAFRHLHAALNAHAGRVMTAQAAPPWLAGDALLAPEQPRLERFFAASQARFFGVAGPTGDAAELLDLARRLSEREAAR